MSEKKKEKEYLDLDPRTAAVIERKKWKLHEKLGQGTYGKVFKAENLDPKGKSDSFYQERGVLGACKVMFIDSMPEEFRDTMVQREIELMTRLRHPHILRVFDIFK